MRDRGGATVDTTGALVTPPSTGDDDPLLIP